MTSVHDVAAYLVARSGSLSTMKLQKLCYYAQGWNLAWTGDPLFGEPIEAWRLGPVCPELYVRHRREAAVSEWKHGAVSNLSDRDKKVLDEIMDFYEPYSGFDLGKRTHQEVPWIRSWTDVDASMRGSTTIQVEVMREFFRGLDAIG